MLAELGLSLIIEENFLVIFLSCNFPLLIEIYDNLRNAKEKHGGCAI